MTEIGSNSLAARANIYVGAELFAEDAPDPLLTKHTHLHHVADHRSGGRTSRKGRHRVKLGRDLHLITVW